jgi:hypothetical protein
MAFTARQLSNAANAALDFIVRGPALSQSIQDKPTLKKLKEKQKSFPGGKGNIDMPVKGDYTTAIAGYTHNDTVTYGNPANIKRVKYPWKEVHAGIAVTYTELKIDGISVDEGKPGGTTSEHSERDVTVLTGLLEDKMEDMVEGYARTFNDMLWKDGTQDSKQVPGILSILTTTPTVGVLGGLDRATTAWWRHRYTGGINASPANQTLTKLLRKEFRQLRRYVQGAKEWLWVGGSAFIEALEGEIFEKGVYTQAGFSSNKATDIAMAEIQMKGVGTLIYDPTLDDMGLSKECFFIDVNGIKLMPMDGEEDKPHSPTRPYDQYTLYRAMTWTGGLVTRQLNSSGRYAIA